MTTATLYSTKQVADELGISTRLVRRLAERMGLGIQVGKARAFTAADVEAMRNRNRQPGRPTVKS